MYKLLIYTNIGDNFFLIDTVYGEDRDDLANLARIRKSNNPNYKCFLVDYKPVEAEAL